jgi:hypothetical protein
MKRNEGLSDRIIRIAFAVAAGLLIGLNLISGTWAIVIGIVGGIFLVTGIAGVCPLYMLFGISTVKK